MISAVDPDLQITRGPGYPDRDIRSGGWGGGGGGRRFKKKISSALRASVWSKNTGVQAPLAPPLDPPLDLTLLFSHFYLDLFSVTYFLLHVIKTQLLSVNSYVHLGDLPRKTQESLLRSLASRVMSCYCKCYGKSKLIQ